MYLSEKGKTVGPGSLSTANNGAVAAKLTLGNDSVTGVYLNDNTPLELADLLIDVEQEGNSYSFYNSKSHNYLSLSEKNGF